MTGSIVDNYTSLTDDRGMEVLEQEPDCAAGEGRRQRPHGKLPVQHAEQEDEEDQPEIVA